MKNKLGLIWLLIPSIITILGSVFFGGGIALGAADPELPRVYLDTTYPSLSASRVIRNVKSTCSQSETDCYTSLQLAIDQAVPGDEIVVQASMKITGPITLKNKTGSSYIIIRSSNLANLPASGTRVSPANAVNMPKIVAPGSNVPAMMTAAGAHHYRIVGIEFAKFTPSTVTDTLILSGDGSSAQNTLAEVPHDLVFDRIYVHGDSTSDLKRGLGLNSASTAIIDSYFSDLHLVGGDSQAIGGWNGTGPYKIYNNYIEGAAENFLLGGSSPSVPNLIPSDIDIQYNLFYKPRSWKVGDPSYAGKHWAVKNLFELKNSQRVFVRGNIFDGTWADGQTGYAILFTVRGQGVCSWCVVADVTFEKNIVRHAGSGFQILGHDDAGPSALTQRIKISNNLWDDINGNNWGGSGWWAMIESGTAAPGPSDVQLVHNTVFQNGNFINASPYLNSTFIAKPNFVITDNIAAHNSYGVIGHNTGIGNDALEKFFPGVVFTKNVLQGGNATLYNRFPGNFFPATWGNTFVNQANGDYHVLAASVYHNAGTDGKDLGADIDAINAAISGTGTPPTDPVPVLGDLNLDHAVNSIDYSILNGKWFTNDDNSDLNRDTIVNAIDFSILNSNWLRVW